MIGGAVIGSKEYVKKQLEPISHDLGSTMSPEDAYRVIRGLKTFPLRMDAHNENAMKIAEFLESHSAIKTVNYPGLESHPQHEIAKKQMITVYGKNGYGGVISFELKSGKDAGIKLMDYAAKNSDVISLAVSLGGVDTLVQHPASMTHASIPEKEKLAKHITPGLVRISVGIEDYEDIEKDLKKALDLVS